MLLHLGDGNYFSFTLGFRRVRRRRVRRCAPPYRDCAPLRWNRGPMPMHSLRGAPASPLNRFACPQSRHWQQKSAVGRFLKPSRWTKPQILCVLTGGPCMQAQPANKTLNFTYSDRRAVAAGTPRREILRTVPPNKTLNFTHSDRRAVHAGSACK